MKKSIALELSEEELNLILSAIGNLPYIQVHQLIHKIQQQAGPQLIEHYQNGKEIISQHSEARKHE